MEVIFTQSTKIRVDEYLSSWYGIGREYINDGFPMYVEIYRKPDNGYGIQDADEDKTGKMIRLRLVNNEVEEEANSMREDEDGLIHGTKTLLELVEPWANTDRIVCGDSHFASFLAEKTSKKI